MAITNFLNLFGHSREFKVGIRCHAFLRLSLFQLAGISVSLLFKMFPLGNSAFFIMIQIDQKWAFTNANCNFWFFFVLLFLFWKYSGYSFGKSLKMANTRNSTENYNWTFWSLNANWCKIIFLQNSKQYFMVHGRIVL